MNLKELMLLALENAIEAFNRLPKKESEMLMAHWLFLRQDGQVEVLFTPLDEHNKDAVAAVVRQLIEDQRPLAYAYVSETWMACVDSPDELIGQVRDHPGREEALMIVGRDVHGQQCHVSAMIRPGRELGEPVWDWEMTSSGRFVPELVTGGGRA